MSAKILLDDVLIELRQKSSNLRCADVVGLLSSLGFDVREGKKGGHKVYTHQQLPDFISSSFNCGHAKNSQIKAHYIKQIARTIVMHKFALEDYLVARGE